MIEHTMRLSERPGWSVTPRSRRLAEIRINDEGFLKLFLPGLTYRVESDPYPEDAHIVGVEYDFVAQGWRVFVESETFDEVPEAVMPPILPAPVLLVTVIDSQAPQEAR